MLIIPAVDIKDGKCVRLLQGRMDQETRYADNPLDMALRWESQGAGMIHVVDLNGAFEKKVKNLGPIQSIVEKTGASIQVGGGIRTTDTVRMYFDIGVARVVIGSQALYDPAFVKDLCRQFPGRIVLGIDARNGMVAVEGWRKVSEKSAVSFAKEFEESGVAAINFTDIQRDGMRTGPNFDETKRLAESVSIPVVASGGVSSIEDIRKLSLLEPNGVEGVITGKALYEGEFELKEAIAVTQSGRL